MKALLESEIRKVLTVRSTYIILTLTLILLAFSSTYIEGYSNSGAPFNEHKLYIATLGVIPAFMILGAIWVMIQAAHEYRHNLITYTLTAARNRNQVIAAKLLTATACIVAFTVFFIFLSIILTFLGTKIKGIELPQQQLELLSLLWRGVFYGLGFSLLGVAMVLLFRNLIPALIILLIGLGTVEALVGLLLKKNSVYLPLGSLQQLMTDNPQIPSLRAAGVFVLYLAALWGVTWYLFLRRDAN